jgi:hypothetical protein
VQGKESLELFLKVAVEEYFPQEKGIYLKQKSKLFLEEKQKAYLLKVGELKKIISAAEE